MRGKYQFQQRGIFTSPERYLEGVKRINKHNADTPPNPPVEMPGSENLRDTAITLLIRVARAAHHAMDNAEECPDDKCLMFPPWSTDLDAALTALEELPDNQPGIVIESGAAKAEYILSGKAAPMTDENEQEIEMDKYVLALKACPHCGRLATFRKVEPTLNGAIHPLGGSEYVECTNRLCGASTVAMVSAGDDCRPLLAERWNRRILELATERGETPRTDAACQDEPKGASVNADFARQLERELSTAQAQIAALEAKRKDAERLHAIMCNTSLAEEVCEAEMRIVAISAKRKEDIRFCYARMNSKAQRATRAAFPDVFQEEESNE